MNTNDKINALLVSMFGADLLQTVPDGESTEIKNNYSKRTVISLYMRL
jgi:hypothetical protein